MSAEPIWGLVSTIIPVHNRPDLLAEAVASVIAQGYRPIEVIIVDDGSADATPVVAQRLVEENAGELTLLRQQNAGPGLAREAGRQAARGEFIQYLDSDDVLLPSKFELQVAELRRRPECGVVYGKTQFRHLQYSTPPRIWKRTAERVITMFPSFLKSRLWGTSTPLYRSSVTDAAGPWTSLLNEEDWEYDCRIAAQGVQLAYVDAMVSEQRQHEGARLSRGGGVEVAKLQARAVAHGLIYTHAVAAGIGTDVPEMQHFARELFLLARKCGAAGLSEEAKDLFDLARSASGPARGAGIDFRLYGVGAKLLGWDTMGRIACGLDRARR